jgi:anti-anti-sigma factor
VQIEALEVEGVTILYLAGELDANSGRLVPMTLAALFVRKHQRIVLELTAVIHMYAEGISLLAEWQRLCAKSGVQLLFCGARPFIRELLHLTREDHQLNMHVDLDSVLDALARQAS